jgi:hypothetical protein
MTPARIVLIDLTTELRNAVKRGTKEEAERDAKKEAARSAPKSDDVTGLAKWHFEAAG